MSFRRFLVSWLMRKEVGVTEKEWRGMSYSFSQDAEDLVLERILHASSPGFYVDVGAYHPVSISNTWLFYQLRGWRGICIEPNPEMAQIFRRRRPRDIVVETAVGLEKGWMDYEMFDEPNYNRIADPNLRPHYLDRLQAGKRLKKVRVEPLDDLLARHLPANTFVDFLSIDCEGFDFQILQSNNWQQVRPRAICLESHEQEEQQQIQNYLLIRGYELAAKINFSHIFRRLE
ncbi:MAG: FkbM family methyltransferase [Verrucomicrobia bacterium]|nr:FkbM family methyltransferase [Verrucomicrobiota bacterium]